MDKKQTDEFFREIRMKDHIKVRYKAGFLKDKESEFEGNVNELNSAGLLLCKNGREEFFLYEDILKYEVEQKS